MAECLVALLMFAALLSALVDFGKVLNQLAERRVEAQFEQRTARFIRQMNLQYFPQQIVKTPQGIRVSDPRYENWGVNYSLNKQSHNIVRHEYTSGSYIVLKDVSAIGVRHVGDGLAEIEVVYRTKPKGNVKIVQRVPVAK
jgi:hypothetical protein